MTDTVGSSSIALMVLGVLFCLLVARFALHLGGFWELGALQRFADSNPVLAWFIPLASVTKDPLAHYATSDFAKAATLLARTFMLILALGCGMVAILLLAMLIHVWGVR